MSKYLCNDGNAEIEIEANSADEAAREYVDGGDWGDRSKTTWISVRVTPLRAPSREEITAAVEAAGIDPSALTWFDDRAILSVGEGWDIDDLIAELPEGASAEWAGSSNTDGNSYTTEDIRISWVEVAVKDESERITVTLEAEEPECEDGDEHDWRSPHEVVGGLEENPGVFGHGGGVITTKVCARCGNYRITDTWATNPENGVQGLRSVEYRDADEASLAWVEKLRAEESDDES